MKNRPAKLLVMLSAALISMTAFTANISNAAESQNPFIGTWDLNISESDFGSAPVPADMSRVYADLGDDTYMYLVVTINEDGSFGGTSATYTYSGEQYPMASLAQLNTPSISYNKINETTVEYTVRLGGEVQQIGAKFISPNYQQLTIAIQFPNSDAEDQILIFNRRS